MRDPSTGPTHRGRVIALAIGGFVTAAGLTVAVAASAANEPDRHPADGGTQAAAHTSSTGVAATHSAPAAESGTPGQARAAAAASSSATRSSATKKQRSADPVATRAATAATLKKDQAKEVVENGLSAALEQPDTAKKLRTAVNDVAQEDYLEELEAQWQELEAYGWQAEGSPRVLSTKVRSQSAKDRTAVISACIDSSAVRFLDADGKAINAKANRPGPATQIFTVQQGKDARWRIVDRSFPADPACGNDAEPRTKR